MPLCVTAVTPSRAEGSVRLCRKTRSGFERLILRLTASGCIDDITNIACFAVFARRKTARSRADDGVFRQSLEQISPLRDAVHRFGRNDGAVSGLVKKFGFCVREEK